jgi:hypothetical protein
MTDKHTPGPWQSGGCVVYGPDGAGVADLVAGVCNHNGRSPDETEANARLIAAAPELLKALEPFAAIDVEGTTLTLEHLENARAAIKAAKEDA